MKHAIACLNTQIGILLHNASVFHGEGREEDRDRNITEADDLRMAVEALKDEIPLSERMGLDPADPWEETAKQHLRNEQLYRSIVTRIGELYGESVKFCEPSILPELVETSVNQFRLLASFVGSKATSHTEIVSDAAAEIRALRVSLEAERQRRIDAERKMVDYDAKAAEVVELRERLDRTQPNSKLSTDYLTLKAELESERRRSRELEFRDYRFLSVGEKLEFTDQYSPGDGTWHPVEDSEGTVGRDEEFQYRRVNTRKYRMLGADEMLRQGDEFRSITGGWGQVIRYGSPVNKTQLGRYRRPVNHVEETSKNRHDEQGYRMLEVGEVTQEGDEVRPVGAEWQRLDEEHWGQRINSCETGRFPVGYYRRPVKLDPVGQWMLDRVLERITTPISLDTEPEKPETPAA